MRKTIYFITHPNVVISADVPIEQWPLSELGCDRMRACLKQQWMSNITAIYCSSEQKAIDGARIIGDHLDLPFQTISELGENDRSSTGFLPAEEFERVADEFFAKPKLSVRGWERAVDAQQRIVTAVETLCSAEQSTGNIAVISHGAVGALLYCSLMKYPISREWDQPDNGGGNYFGFSLNPPRAYFSWRAIDVY